MGTLHEDQYTSLIISFSSSMNEKCLRQKHRNLKYTFSVQ